MPNSKKKWDKALDEMRVITYQEIEQQRDEAYAKINLQTGEITRLRDMIGKKLNDEVRKTITEDDLKNMERKDAEWLTGHINAALDCASKDMWYDGFWWMEKALRLYIHGTNEYIESLKEKRDV